jgi:hypothetical protein
VLVGGLCVERQNEMMSARDCKLCICKKMKLAERETPDIANPVILNVGVRLIVVQNVTS